VARTLAGRGRLPSPDPPEADRGQPGQANPHEGRRPAPPAFAWRGLRGLLAV